jgi:hypothetical protein
VISWVSKLSFKLDVLHHYTAAQQVNVMGFCYAMTLYLLAGLYNP